MKTSLNRMRVFGGLLTLLCLAWSSGRAYAWNHLTPLTNQVACPGGTAVFSTVASGPRPYRFCWYKDGVVIPDENTDTLILTDVTADSAGTYKVVLTGGYDTVSSSATLSVNTLTTVSPLTNLVRNIGGTAVFAPTVAGTGPFSYVWKKDGMELAGQTGSSLELDNITIADAGTYTVEVTGACNTAVQSASLRVNLAPVVTILSPTNGSVFYAPASFPLLANALDPDGTITKVEFYSSTNKLGEATNAVLFSTNLEAYVLELTNLPAGTNLFTAVATDNDGAQATSIPVRVTIVPGVEIQAGPVLYDPQHDPYFVQQVVLTNPTPAAFEAVRIYISNLTNVPPITVYNASGTNDGVPYVDTLTALPPGGSTTVTLIYYSPMRVTPNPVLQAVLLPGGGPASLPPPGTPQHINRGLMLANQTFMVEFISRSNRTYAVIYSPDLIHWKASQPFITGNGTWIQWVDLGQPLTESAPSTVSRRFYQVIELNP